MKLYLVFMSYELIDDFGGITDVDTFCGAFSDKLKAEEFKERLKKKVKIERDFRIETHILNQPKEENFYGFKKSI